MEGDVHGVRIWPPLVEFKDTEVDTIHKIPISVKNVSKTSREIRYYGPQTKNFRLKVKNPDKPVASGLEVAAVVEYETSDAVQHKDRLVVTVDGEVIEVPLLAFPARPLLSLETPVNFKNVVANSKVISREIRLSNHGSKEGEFKIKYSGEKPIAVIPSSGRVPANSSLAIKVEYVTKKPGRFDETARVKLEGQESSSLRIMGNVVEGSLELLSYDNEDTLECVRFGSSHYGTDKTEVAVLFNNGPEPVCFVAVLDEEAVGQELGVDLTKSASSALATTDKLEDGQMNSLTSLVTAIPNQGMLAPYEKIPIFFRFSPRWNKGQQGFKCTLEAAPRRDFAVFMHLKVVGASQGFQNTQDSNEKSNVEGSSLEIALTGTALPVLLSVSPQTRFDFDECPVGEHVDALCTLKNESSSMPVMFKFRRVAHFTARPASGKIKPGQTQDVILSFAPNQVGTFKPTQYVDVVGQVADNQNPFVMHLQTIHSLPIQFLGRSNPVTSTKAPVYNPGITPKITNEVGLYADTKLSESEKDPRAAMLSASGTKIHRLKARKDRDNEDKVMVAFPNDRAQSVRPSDRKERFKTIFTQEERYTYVDPDYAYTDEEAEAVRQHKEQYKELIDRLRDKRVAKIRAKEFRQTDNPTDIALKPAAGLKPKKLLVEDVGPDPRAPTPPNQPFKLLSTKELADAEKTASAKVRDGLNAIPISKKEKADCQRVLSPQELHQVVIGPPTVDFGDVCPKSTNERDLNIINNLDQYIHVVVHVDCRELRQTSPLSQVVPPCSKAILPLIFESNVKGRFQRSLDYTINSFYRSHITVFAQVVPVALHLSAEELLLEPQIGLPADAGIRGVITLQNKLNYSAEFTWNPIVGDRGTAFSIRPAMGTVDAHQALDCEVVFHPSYLAPEEGEFALQVHGGETQHLRCLAKLGATIVQFIDRRIMFGQVPLHMTTTRTAMMKNSSLNHAYFQVLDPNPFPGLTVTPVNGVVPVGGSTELQVHLTPNAEIKFDTRVNIAIRGWKTMDLRMGGTVERPCVDIDLQTFNIGGVYCGSGSSTPFKLTNKANTKARVEFDLSRYTDFELSFPGKQTAEDHSFELMNPGVFTVSLEADETVNCLLHFHPTEVASYDFVIPVTINQTGAPSPSATPFPPTPAPSHKNSLQHIINPRPIQVSIKTPRKKIIATALRQPLQVSHHNLEFVLSPGVYEMTSASGIGQSKGTLLVNNSDQSLKWALDLNKGNQIMEDGIFRFLHPNGMPFMTYADKGVEGNLDPGETFQLGVTFCPEKPGHYKVKLPIVLNDEYDKPYQYIELTGELKAAKLWFDPLAIVLTPLPLETEITADFRILAANYTKNTEVKAEVPEVECEDGSKISPLSVSFPGGKNIIKPCCGEEGQDEPFILPCKVTFTSPKPVSFSQPIKFVDEQGSSFQLLVTATADNCLLTCYPFLAQHRADHQIVCELGHSLKGRKTVSRESSTAGEAVLVPCDSPTPSRPSTIATASTNFEVSTSAYEDSSQSYTESTYPSTPRDGALNKFTTDSVEVHSHGRNDLQSRSLGSALFPEEDSEEGIFHVEVLVAIQRWFSSQGWPGGPNPIVIPESLRSGISKKPSEEKAKNAKGQSFEANNLKKEFKTVYDMVAHLCGKQVPGIPINNPLPPDPIERAKQVYWQHSTLLTFMRTQGACVASVKPEYLMEPRDYKCWVQLQKEVEMKKNKSGHWDCKPKTEEDEAIEDQLFEAVSKRAWTDILMQMLKTLLLARITPRQFKSLPTPYKHSGIPVVDPDPLCSNVYSLSERIVLLWLNHNYEQQRQVIWRNCVRGGVPPARWVVNFDFDLLDGLVIGAILGAHVPFLIKSHLEDMYTRPATAEQCLHNALKVVNAMRSLGIDYDIQAIDITDPNPISLLMLCIHLYNNLPQFIPKSTIDFVGGLHTTVIRQIKLVNPSTKPLTYHAMLAGYDASDFSLPKGDTINISPKSTNYVVVEFRSRFLRPAEAVVVLVGRRHGSNVGCSLVFSLCTQIDDIAPKVNIKCESPCYELNKVIVEVNNPFPHGGDFRIVLVESKTPAADRDKSASSSNSKKNKPKKVKSRINHGQKTKAEEPEEAVIQTKQQQDAVSETGGPLLSAFYCPSHSVYLSANSSDEVTIHFLPLQLGKRQCSVIFINEDIGEFLYSIDATATLPISAALPFKPSSGSVRISSAAAAGRGRGMFGGDDNIIYWKCECGRQLQETIQVPINNIAKERALVIAAEQQMSEAELERRRLTGSLTSGVTMAKAVEMLTTSSASLDQLQTADNDTPKYTIELDSKFFSAPATMDIPQPVRQPEHGELHSDANTVTIPVTFLSKEAGHYPCRLVLKSADDVRVYHIECTVTPEGSEAQIEFTSPVHKPITQDIPIINQTNHDWPMKATIEGTGFSGPKTLMAKAFQTTQFPLIFRPQHEGAVQGKLVLVNTADGVEHNFYLSGKGERPLPLEQIIVDCKVKECINRVLDIPNVTKKKLFYRAESDLDCLSGPDVVSVLPGQVGKYELQVKPLKRGRYKGVISFVAGDNPLKEVDSDGDEVVDPESDPGLHGYRVWYSVEVNVEPAAPEKSLEICCACQKKAVLEVGVNNPTREEICLQAEVSGEGLSGPCEITLSPHARGVYELLFFPTFVGQFKGSLIFYHEAVGEFWYDLTLMAQKPLPTTLPHMECELGRWVRQYITLTNPTQETLELIPTISNSNNFVLERDNERPVELRPQSTVKIPLTFMPSTLGGGDHAAKISFLCEQLGEWVFLASGTGLLPLPQDPVSITAVARTNSTLIIPFRNPLDVTVLADVQLKDKEQEAREVAPGCAPPEGAGSPFCLLLKYDQAVRLGPKSTLDIPISFAPEDMSMSEALCTVSIMKEDGSSWQYAPTDDRGATLARSRSGGLREMRWLYPIHGFPELAASRDMPPAVIQCQARERVEERLEVTLSGVAPSSGGPKRGIKARAVTPSNKPPRTPDGVVVGETLAMAEEFSYELVFGDEDGKKSLEPAVALTLVRQHRDKNTGLVVLIFNVIYAPYKTMQHDVQLLVQGATGGLWRFPLSFSATEPEPDDTIIIEAAGLNRESSVGFRLYSPVRHPVPYNAYFVAGSDVEFSVSPQTGELLPTGSNGTLVKINFKPSKYGKIYQGKLVVQSPEMQWTYSVRGVLPEYMPPRGYSSCPMAGPHPDPRRRSDNVNYIKDNLRLTTTAVSSPIKGAPLVIKQRQSAA